MDRNSVIRIITVYFVISLCCVLTACADKAAPTEEVNKVVYEIYRENIDGSYTKWVVDKNHNVLGPFYFGNSQTVSQ